MSREILTQYTIPPTKTKFHSFTSIYYVQIQHATTMNPHTFWSTCESEGHQCTYNTKHFVREQCVHLASVWIWTEQLQYLAPGDNDLLLLRAREVAVDGMSDACATLQGQIVQEHGGVVTRATSDALDHLQHKHHWKCTTDLRDVCRLSWTIILKLKWGESDRRN